MSSDLIPSTSRSLSLRERRQAVVLRDEQLPAKRAAVRIQAAAIAAHTGLTCTETLTQLEVQAIKRQGAVMDERARQIVDAYAGLVTNELARLSTGSW